MKKTILVFAPHPDDELLGCGGYIAQQSSDVHIIIVSDGAKGLSHGEGTEIRQQECLEGLAHLEIASDQVQFWGYPDASIPLSGEILTDYQQVVFELKPSHVLLPNPQESHPDHVRVTRAFLKALEGMWQGELLFYETVSPVTVTNYVVDISAEFDKKLLAMQAHRSQLRQFDYIAQIQALTQLRGLQKNVSQAEAFLQHSWDGTAQNFFETRPLISVIVRANDMDYLRYALHSLTQQSYAQFEVILVWFGEQVPALQEFEILDIRVVAGKASRSFNLNQGLRTANGEYIAMLDQDDVLYPDHFAFLLAEIHGQPKIDIVYSGCNVVACEKQGQQIKAVKLIKNMNRPWVSGRILIGNTVPNHALLFRAAVFHMHQFDEKFEVYEDWELLTRLSLANFRFVHLAENTCEYRIFNEEEIQTYHQAHESKGYLGHQKAVFGKFLKHLREEHLEQIAILVDDLEKQSAVLEQQLKQQIQQSQAQKKVITQHQEVEKMLALACAATGVQGTGRLGIAQLISKTLPQEILFSIILPVYNTDPTLLSQMLLSIRNQAYSGWELCLVDDASDSEQTQQILQAIQNDTLLSERTRFIHREQQGGIVAASNDALKLASAPYVVFVDHDDLLHGEALLALALEIQQHDYTLLYTDSCLIDHTGKLMHTNRKMDWSPETLLHINYINHLTVVKRTVLNKLGGLSPQYEGAQDWSLLLQLVDLAEQQICHVPLPLYDWRATQGSLAYHSSEKTWAFDAAQSALQNHLQKRGLNDVIVTANDKGPGFVCQWSAPEDAIDIIIPTHTNLAGLKTCLNGILQHTDYPEFRIIVVANRATDEVYEYLESMQVDPRLTVLTNNDAFNWSVLNNQAVSLGDSPMLLFLNDDIEIKQASWLHDLRQYLLLEGVGVVGATLFYPGGDLQHNGIKTDVQWVASNIQEWGNKQQLAVTRNVSAVTGACLLTKRDVWQQVNGFDENFAVAFNDVDFCLAIRAQGQRIVQASNVELIHHEHATLGGLDNPEKQRRHQKEINLMQEKWQEQLRECYTAYYDVQLQRTRILHVNDTPIE